MNLGVKVMEFSFQMMDFVFQMMIVMETDRWKRSPPTRLVPRRNDFQL